MPLKEAPKRDDTLTPKQIARNERENEQNAQFTLAKVENLCSEELSTGCAHSLSSNMITIFRKAVKYDGFLPFLILVASK